MQLLIMEQYYFRLRQDVAMRTDKYKLKLSLPEDLRIIAENQLRDIGNRINQPADLIEMRHLFHELQIHEIELEMQNEELHRSHAELLKSDTFNRGILNALISNIAVIDMHGCIIAVNEAWSRFSLDNNAVNSGVGANYLDVCRQAAIEKYPNAAQSLAGIESVLYGAETKFTMEYACHSPDQQRWFIMTVVPLGSPGTDGAVISHFDITERKHTEEALRNSERNYREIFNAVNDAIFVHDAETGAILDVNDAMRRLYGFTYDETAGLHVSDGSMGVSPYSSKEAEQWMAKTVAEGPQVFEWHARKKGGELFWVEVALKSANINGKQCVLAVVRDIGERINTKKLLFDLNLRLSDMNEHLLSIQEQERTSIARDIHDDLGQNLALLKLDVESIQLKIPAGNCDLNQTLTHMRESIKQISGKVQRIAAKLRPPLLDNVGLTAAIEWQVSEVKKRSDVEFFLMLNEEADVLDQTSSIVIIRIVQECLTNIIRHANATEVSISLSRRGSSIFLEITDNGCGITTDKLNCSKAYGLMGMRERARSCHGNLKISGIPEKGTTVSLTIPLEHVDGTP